MKREDLMRLMDEHEEPEHKEEALAFINELAERGRDFANELRTKDLFEPYLNIGCIAASEYTEALEQAGKIKVNLSLYDDEVFEKYAQVIDYVASLVIAIVREYPETCTAGNRRYTRPLLGELKQVAEQNPNGYELADYAEAAKHEGYDWSKRFSDDVPVDALVMACAHAVMASNKEPKDKHTGELRMWFDHAIRGMSLAFAGVLIMEGLYLPTESDDG